MTEREQLEAEIRQLLVTETHAIRLSNKLFSPPDGLFSRIGLPLTPEQRREVAVSELFKAAQQRIQELERELLDRRHPTITPSGNQPVPPLNPLQTALG
jgi:hypothetical protein